VEFLFLTMHKKYFKPQSKTLRRLAGLRFGRAGQRQIRRAKLVAAMKSKLAELKRRVAPAPEVAQ